MNTINQLTPSILFDCTDRCLYALVLGEGCRMLDTWRNEENAAEQTTQSLRCYSPADFSLLIRDLDLTLVYCELGGAMAYENGIYTEQAPSGPVA